MELLPHRRCDGGVLVVEVLEQWQLLETHPLEGWELISIILSIIAKENCLEVVAEQDVKCLQTW